MPGIAIDNAIETLRNLSRTVSNVNAPPPSQGIEGVIARRDEYLAWVDMAEPRLVAIYGPEALPLLHTDNYWQIWSMDIYGPRPIALINNEAARQQRLLGSLADQLVERCESFKGDDEVFVIDTNVFMHYHTLNEPEQWCHEALRRPSIVVVPLRVVQELDQKKQSTNNRLQKRARKTLGLMSDLLDGALSGPVAAGVVLHVVVEPDVYDPQADAEILNVAGRVQMYARRDLTVLTGDLSMQLRARAYGLRAEAMPLSLRFPLADDFS